MKPATVILALALLAPAVAASTETGSPRGMTLEARRLMESGDVAGALGLMSSARAAMQAQAAPDRELADALAGQLHNAGVRLSNAGDAPLAMKAFEEALRLDDWLHGVRDASFRERLRGAVLQTGRFLAVSGQPGPAMDACRLLASRAPADAEALALLGTVHLALKDPDRALERFEQAAAASPKLAEALAGAGQARLQQAERLRAAGSLEEGAHLAGLAVEWMERAVEAAPREPSRHTALASALIRMAALRERLGDVSASSAARDRAGAALEAAVGLDPEAPGARLELAQFLFAEGDHLRAAEEFGRAGSRLEALLRTAQGSREAPSWEVALEAARDNRAAAWHNLAVDAVNGARFGEAASLLDRLCLAGPRWEAVCRSMRATLARRRESFERAVAAHQGALAGDSERATALLALGDLHAHVGDYARAADYYGRLSRAGGSTPGLADRISAVTDPGPLPELSRVVEVDGGRVRLTFYDPALEQALATAVKAAWERVIEALGEGSLAGELAVVVHPTRRVFRERAGARVGGLVKGYYHRGRISLFQTPSHTTAEWLSALTHEMAHHAVERLAGGRAPRWLTEGVARHVEGDAAVLDRARLRERAASGDLPALRDLDTVMLRSWNDPGMFMDGRDLALRAVEEIVRLPAGAGGLRGALRRLAAAGDDEAALEKALGISLPDLDAAWRRKDLASAQ